MADPTRIDEFVRLFTSHELRLRAYSMSLIPNHADAEDVLQQSSLLLWKKFDQFQTGTNFMGWATRVVLHEAQRQRRRQVRDKLKFGDAFFEAVDVEATSESMGAELAQQEALLGACIAKLRPEHQEILRAKYGEGFSVERMAASFNRSVEAIYNVLSRIRRSLQNCVNSTNRHEV